MVLISTVVRWSWEGKLPSGPSSTTICLSLPCSHRTRAARHSSRLLLCCTVLTQADRGADGLPCEDQYIIPNTSIHRPKLRTPTIYVPYLFIGTLSIKKVTTYTRYCMTVFHFRTKEGGKKKKLVFYMRMCIWNWKYLYCSDSRNVSGLLVH